jgi:ribosomal protein L37AE/L43A
MPRTIRAYACEDCGRWTVRKRVSNDPRICEQCGQERAYYARIPHKRPTPYGGASEHARPKSRG